MKKVKNVVITLDEKALQSLAEFEKHSRFNLSEMVRSQIGVFKRNLDIILKEYPNTTIRFDTRFLTIEVTKVNKV